MEIMGTLKKIGDLLGIQKSDNIKIFEEHGAQNDMLEMTGNVAVNKRLLFKRLFFLTPQVPFSKVAPGHDAAPYATPPQRSTRCIELQNRLQKN